MKGNKYRIVTSPPKSVYKRYKLHKVKKKWVVKSSVIGAMILGSSLGPSTKAESLVQNEADMMDVLPEGSDRSGLVRSPLTEKVDKEIVQPALTLARAVENEPEIAALIQNLLKIQADNPTDTGGTVTNAANELRAAIPAVESARRAATTKANQAINQYKTYIDWEEGWTYHNVLDQPYQDLLAARSGATATPPTVTTAELKTFTEAFADIGAQVEDEIMTLWGPGPLSDQGGEAVQTTVTYRYLSESGKVILPAFIADDAIVGEQIAERNVEIEGYTFKEISSDSDSDMLANPDGSSTVTYIYTPKDAQVIYRYVDEEGKEIAPEQSVSTKVDAEIAERMDEIEGYTYLRKSDDSDADMIVDRSGQSTVTYIYSTNNALVTHQYVNEQGETIGEDHTEQAAIGSTIIENPVEIEGYTFKEIDTDTSDEDMKVNSDGTSVITYIYTPKDAQVIYRYVNEAGEEIAYRTISFYQSRCSDS